MVVVLARRSKSKPTLKPRCVHENWAVVALGDTTPIGVWAVAIRSTLTGSSMAGSTVTS